MLALEKSGKLIIGLPGCVSSYEIADVICTLITRPSLSEVILGKLWISLGICESLHNNVQMHISCDKAANVHFISPARTFRA